MLDSKMEVALIQQEEEEDTARKILEKLTRIENSPAGLYTLDKELGKRGND